MNIQQQASLQSHNSLAIPAKAAFLTEITSIDDLRAAIRFANEKELSVLVLGEGSNSLFVDDYQGLVILNRILGSEILFESSERIEISVRSGENWHALVENSVKSGWYGLENLALIPGLVGAAPMQNIGAYGVELSDCLTWVEYFDMAVGELRRLQNAECQFAYRESCFKRELASKVVITAIGLRLSKSPAVNISYPSLRQRFQETPSPLEVFSAVCEIRSAKLPMPSSIPNAGSFFKNPLVSAKKHAELKRSFPNLVSFKAHDSYKLAAAWMIEYAGWKKREMNGVRVHSEQALVLLNPKHRDGRAVLDFAQAIQTDIKETFGVDLEIEPRIHS